MSSTSTSSRSGTPRRQRPLSPHLSIYRLVPTMIASIMHRFTGGALYFGTLLVAWWLIAAATGPGAFALANGVLSSWFGLLVLFVYSWVLMLHMLGGIRHFLWDMGLYDSKPVSTVLAKASFAGSAVLTVLIWLIALGVR
ncbi:MULTISPECIES: succinate dehydrogenase, cytochrome b556 subunit [unclassified Roseitalea]|uniref:succinate dehydrogenase, cytochrome b556 subunit n=1 Tax=unclassified Roseitalea TaxID=2639107 RepID=UPI00273EA212|nr:MULTISPECIES: succinate dehydrogenase, cytochrome b556 subunit [unclassified Roseitalea]